MAALVEARGAEQQRLCAIPASAPPPLTHARLALQVQAAADIPAAAITSELRLLKDLAG
jgi:hypothetical protein